MPSKWRRFEVLIPLQWNDGQEIPEELLGEAVFEILDQFTGVGFENLNVVGHWLHEGTVYRDNLSRIIVDVPDTRGSVQRECIRSAPPRCLPQGRDVFAAEHSG